MLDKIFGDPSDLAILITSCEFRDGICWADIKFSLLGYSIGGGRVAPLLPFFSGVNRYLRRCSDVTEIGRNLSCQEFHSHIEHILHNSDPSVDEEYNRAVFYKQFLFGSNWGEFFDGWTVFVVRNPEICRVLFKSGEDRLICAELEWSYIESVLGEFLDWTVDFYESHGQNWLERD